MATWRAAGLNYVSYSNIAARTLRKSLNAKERTVAERRDATTVTINYWKNGEMLKVGEKLAAEADSTAAAARSG